MTVYDVYLLEKVALHSASVFAVINSHIAAKYIYIYFYLAAILCFYQVKERIIIVDARVNTHCRGDDLLLSLQSEIPPYESRITTAKLLVESEEYEVKMRCVLCLYSLLLLVCVRSVAGGRPGVCMCVDTRLCAFPRSE